MQLSFGASRVALVRATLILAFGLFAAPFGLRAATDVSGIISSNTTWTAANGPFTVVGAVQVASGATLTIEPGVTVKYAGAYMIYVQGALVANGTAALPIKFTSTTPGTSSGATMLKFEGANLDNTQMSYVQFTDAAKAVLLGGGGGEHNPGIACTGTLTVTQGTFTNVEVRTGGYNTTAKLVLANATVTNATIIGQYPSSEPITLTGSTVTNSVINSDAYNFGITLTNTNVSGSQLKIGCCSANITVNGGTVSGSSIVEGAGSPVDGVMTLNGATLTNTTIVLPSARCNFSSSTITFTSGTPQVIFASGTVTGSTLTGFGTGVGLEFGTGNGNVTVSGTTFSGFASGLRFSGTRNSGTLTVQPGNHFASNSTYNLENKTSKPVDAIGTDWGTTDPFVIAQKIYDNADDATKGLVSTVNASSLTITGHPSSATVAPGSTVNFSVSATGTPAPGYQWYKNGSPISGETNATLTLSNVQAGSAGTYAAAVSNSAGVLASNSAVLTLATTGPVNVSGQLSGNVTWSAAFSPYIVTGDVQVPVGATLTIEPGVTVRYAGAYMIYVQGALVANGTAALPIKFGSTTPGTSSGATMLKFEGANLNNTQLSYVQFSDAAKAILLGSGGGEFNPGIACTGTLTVTQGSFTNAEVRTGGYGTTAKLVLANATVNNTTIIGQYPRSEPITLRGSTVTNSVLFSDSYNLGITLTATNVSGSQLKIGCCGANLNIGTGSTVSGSSIVATNDSNQLTISGAALTNTTIDLPPTVGTITNSTITFTSGTTPKVLFGSGTVTGSTFTGFGTGVGLEFGTGLGNVSVTNSTISGFATGLKFSGTRNSGTFTARLNNFTGNANYNLENRTSSPVNATACYWGTTSAAQIAQKIYDNADDVTLGLVSITPTFSGPVANPTIQAHPIAQTITAGNPVTFTVVVNSVGTPTYQWRKNGTAISGNTSATTASFTIPIVQYTDAASYDCVVVDEIGTVTSDAAALTFVKGTVAVTLGNLSATYDGQPHAATATAPTVPTTPSTLAISVTYNGSPTPPTVAGSYPVVATVNDLNFSGSATDTLTIAKAPLAIAADAKTRVYGSANPILTGIITGFVNGETLVTAGVSGAAVFSTSATTASGVGPYSIIPAVGTLNAANYAFTTFTPGTLTVIQASLTVTADAKSKVYGTVVPTLTATISGFVNGETLANSGVTGAAAITSTATSASGAGSYPITTAVGTLVSTNYAFVTFSPGTLTVTKAPLTVTADAKSKTYGDALPAFSATVTGFVNGESLANSGVTGAASLSTTATAQSGVGVYPITPTLGTLAAVNYAFTSFVDGSLTIGKAVLTVTADNLTRGYGSANPTFTSAIGGFVNGDTLASAVTGAPVLTTTAGLSSPQGTYPITVAIGTLAASNYSFTLVDGTLTVAKAVLVVTVDPKTKIYGDAVPALTATITGFLNGDTVATVVTGAPALSTSATAASAAGSYPITAAAGTLAAANYTLTFASGTLTVAKATLTVTGDAKSKVYGEANPALTATITGFVNGEALANSGITGGPALTTTATPLSDVDSYAIAPSKGTLTAANYDFVFVNGTLTVTKTDLVVTADNASRVVGTSNPTFTATLSGFVGGQTLATSGVTGSAAITTLANIASNVGAYELTPSLGTLAARNYAFTKFVAGTLAILPAPPVVVPPQPPSLPIAVITLSDLNHVYDGTPKAATALITPAGTPVVLTYNGSSTPPTAAGSYAVVATASGANFTVSTSGTLTIAKASQTITFSGVPATLAIGSPFTITTTASSGLTPVSLSILSGNATLSGASLTMGDSGPVVVRATQAGNGNYNAATADLTLSVTKLDQTITFPALSDRPTTAGPVALNASASSGLAVVFSVVSGPATITNGLLTTTRAGIVVVRASQPGNSAYDPATPVERSFIVTEGQAAPAITTQPSPQAAIVGGSATFGVVATGAPAPTYQWRKDGLAIAGATGATFGLANVQATDAAGYDVVVANPSGSVVSSLARLTVSASATTPVITRQPGNVTVVAGRTVILSVTATGAPAPTYQWRKDGADVAGATDAALTLTNVTRAMAGVYSVAVRNSAGSAISGGGLLKVLLRSYVGDYFGSLGNGGTFALHINEDNTGVFLGFAPGSATAYISRNVTINDDGSFGFVVPASASEAVVALQSGERASPPRAAAVNYITFSGTIAESGALSGVSAGGMALNATKSPTNGAMAGSAGFYQATASGSSAQTFAIVSPSGQAFVLVQNGGSVDAASGTLDATGAVTLTTASRQTLTVNVANETAALAATITDSAGRQTSFAGYAENSVSGAAQRFVNISTRANVASAEQVAIVGFVVTGLESKTVLVRAIGPALRSFGVNTALAAPKLDLLRGSTVVASNTGWSAGTNAGEITATAARAGAFPLTLGSADSVTLTTLAPGAYTAIVSAADSRGGVGLLEVYDLSGGSTDQKLANMSTRAVVGAGDNTLIAGFVISGVMPKRVLLRGVGPALAQFGITGALSRPQITLLNGTTVIAQNSGWSSSVDAAEIAAAAGTVGAFSFTDGSADSAILINLPPGAYTAQVTGVSGATGVGLVEIYEVP